jgi:hypothetical protein
LRFDLGLRLLEIGNGEFELLDELPAALGGLAELGAARLGQQELQPLDLEPEAGSFALGEIGAGLRRDEQTALLEDHRMRSGEVGRQRLRGRDHIVRESRTLDAREPHTTLFTAILVIPPRADASCAGAPASLCPPKDTRAAPE